MDRNEFNEYLTKELPPGADTDQLPTQAEWLEFLLSDYQAMLKVRAKESKEEIDNEESEDTFNSLLSLDPSKLLGRGGGSGENVAGEMTGNLSPIGANLESSTKGLSLIHI